MCIYIYTYIYTCRFLYTVMHRTYAKIDVFVCVRLYAGLGVAPGSGQQLRQDLARSPNAEETDFSTLHRLQKSAAGFCGRRVFCQREGCCRPKSTALICGSSEPLEFDLLSLHPGSCAGSGVKHPPRERSILQTSSCRHRHSVASRLS